MQTGSKQEMNKQENSRQEPLAIRQMTPENQAQWPVSPEIICDFLHEHLDRFRDSKQDITRCLNYALGRDEHRRGCVLLALDAADSTQPKLLGVAVLCETGMSGYVPENLLVYLAVDSRLRSRGIGKQLMQQTLSLSKGDVALHVEPDNPARRLYERIGFSNKYLEMRYSK